MCKAPKVEAAPAPAAPAAPATTQTPELEFNENTSPTARRRGGRMSLRTDKGKASTGVQMPKMKSVI